jgi:hypothetical protein
LLRTGSISQQQVLSLLKRYGVADPLTDVIPFESFYPFINKLMRKVFEIDIIENEEDEIEAEELRQRKEKAKILPGSLGFQERSDERNKEKLIRKNLGLQGIHVNRTTIVLPSALLPSSYLGGLRSSSSSQSPSASAAASVVLLYPPSPRETAPSAMVGIEPAVKEALLTLFKSISKDNGRTVSYHDLLEERPEVKAALSPVFTAEQLLKIFQEVGMKADFDRLSSKQFITFMKLFKLQFREKVTLPIIPSSSTPSSSSPIESDSIADEKKNEGGTLNRQDMLEIYNELRGEVS